MMTPSDDIESGLAQSQSPATNNQAPEKITWKNFAVAFALFSLALFGVAIRSDSPIGSAGPSDELVQVHRQLRVPFYVGVSDTKPVKDRENEIGAGIDIVVKFQGTETLSYNSLVKPNLDQGKKVVMVIEFKSSSYTNLPQVANGDYDSALHKFIDEMLEDGNREVYIRPLHEFNADWYPWGTYRGGDNSPEEFKRAFRHVANVFKFRGANVKIQLDYNCNNSKDDKKSFYDWFPGEDVVDMIMCNAYNRAGVDEYHMTWNSFSDTISDGYERIAALPGNMPLGIGETSTTNSGGNKAQWFRDSFEDIFTKFDRIQEVDYFLINKGNTNWDLNSDEERRAFGESINKYKGGS